MALILHFKISWLFPDLLQLSIIFLWIQKLSLLITSIVPVLTVHITWTLGITLKEFAPPYQGGDVPGLYLQTVHLFPWTEEVYFLKTALTINFRIFWLFPEFSDPLQIFIANHKISWLFPLFIFHIIFADCGNPT